MSTISKSQTQIDWSIRNEPGVAELLERVADSISSRWEGVIEKDDISQEGAIVFAMNADKVRCIIDSGDETAFAQARSLVANATRALLNRLAKEESRGLGSEVYA